MSDELDASNTVNRQAIIELVLLLEKHFPTLEIREQMMENLLVWKNKTVGEKFPRLKALLEAQATAFETQIEDVPPRSSEP